MTEVDQGLTSVHAGSLYGESPDFATLYTNEIDRQTRRAMVLARTPDAAADAVHEAFVDVYRNWNRLTDARAYLDRAVVNRCRDDGRRASSRFRTSVRLRREPVHHVEPPADHDDELWNALLTLPFNQRAAIVLRVLMGHTEAEIAELLDCRPGSVGPWIHRGLASMRKALTS
ncbi:MAG: sigma factor-like helix-turn-helix DNA-binding protein [Actinomycetota bacterium]